MTGAPARRVVLHIGAPKTGTTYLQSMLWRSRRRLARRGVHVPGKRQGDHFQAGRDVLERRRPPHHPAPAWDGAFDALVADISRSGAPTAVISDERISAATPAQVERTFDRLDGFVVDVVYGVRSFAGLLSSEWQQSVKHGNRRELPEWLAGLRHRDPDQWFWRVHDVPAIVDRWQPPRGRLHVITLPGPDSPDDELWRRFLHVVGTQPPRTARVRRSNESLGYVEASLLARTRSSLPAGATGDRVTDVMSDFLARRVLARQPHQVPITLPPTEREWVGEETARRRHALARDDVALTGDLRELDVHPASFGTMSLDGRGPDVVAATRASLVALLARDEAQKTALRRLRASSGRSRVITVTADVVRIPTDHVMSVARKGRNAAAADERLRAAGISATDPDAALDAGGALIAELVLRQARRSRRVDDLGGPGRRGLLPWVTALVGRP